MASPFALLGMARRATANLRQMSYGTTAAPITPPATDDSNDASSIKSDTARKRTASPLMQNLKALTAVLDTVTITSSPHSTPPVVKSIFSDIASNGSSTILAQEPTSILAESPEMESVDLKEPSNDHLSLSQSSESKDQSAEVQGLEQEKQRLTEQVRVLTSEKERIAGQVQELSTEKERAAEQVRDLTSEKERITGQLRQVSAEKERAVEKVRVLTSEQDRIASELETVSSENVRLVQELKEETARWGTERAGLIAENKEETRRFEVERTYLVEKARDLVIRNESLVQETGGLEKEKVDAEERVAGLQSFLDEKVEECSRLEGVVGVLKREKAESDRTVAALEQYTAAARDELKTLQVRSAKEVEAARMETRRFSQVAAEEKEARDTERAYLEKERSEERRHLDEAKKMFGERVAILENGVEVKERARKRLEDELSIIKRELEESVHVAAALQQQLALTSDGIKNLQESAAARTSALQNDLNRLRQERDDELSSKNDYIYSLNATIDGLKMELGIARQSINDTISQNNATVSQLQAGLTERDRMVEEVEKKKEFLQEQLVALYDELERKEQQKGSLTEDMAYLQKEKDEMDRTVSSLQEQLTLAAGEMKLLRDRSAAKTAGLGEELRRMREERDQGICTFM